MEIWKIIEGSDGKYEISNLGRCRKTGTEYYLRINNSFKYPRYRVPGASQYIHRLMAIAFIPNPKNLETVNHIDGNRNNNSIENLEWCTRSDNTKKYYVKNVYFHCVKIGKYDTEGNLLTVYNSIIEAVKDTNGSRISIIHCLKGRNKKSGGFVWKYIDCTE